MEINSATIKDKSLLPIEDVDCDLEWLSIDSIEGRRGPQSVRKMSRKFSSLSLSTKKEEALLDNISTYNLKDHYEIIDTLGMGTYAYVRHCIDKETGEHVAIKTSRGRNSRDLLKNEYNLLKRLDDDNIVKVFDFIEEGGKQESFLIMEFLEKKTLGDYVAKFGILSEDDAKLVIDQLLKSVQYLHDLWIAHRDIKPENILIGEDKETKLIDFNISKTYSYNESLSGQSDKKFTSVFYTQIGSPLYSAPEIKNCISYSESVDIWGVGIILFTWLFGTLESFALSSLKTSAERGDALREIIKKNEWVSDNCRSLILAMLSISPEDRPTATEALSSPWLSDLN